MKKFICLTLLLGSISLGFAQKAKQNSALRSMVDTERAFARMSEEQGIRPSFIAFIADDGILFRPTAVKGKQWMTEHPLPPSDKRPLLSWYPTIAGMARQGDMGYTTGPWEYKNDIHDAKPVAWGHFLTVWKKQADGLWKFAIDLGISNPPPAEAAAPWQLPKNYKAPKTMKGIWSFSTSKLLARDRGFSKASAMVGAKAAFVSYAARDVRVYRDEKFPFVGQEMAVAALPARPNVWTWEPASGDVSISDDLGYTYGTYKIESNVSTPKIIETGNYFRIWTKQGGVWKVLFDLTNPIPPAKS
jgi:ketosteroid isomerase-like protein